MTDRQKFDPIVRVAMLPSFGAVVGPAPSETHTTSVFVTTAVGSELPAGRMGAAPTLWERMRGRYWHYEVDMRHHPAVLRFNLPAREEAFRFTATVTMLWSVRDPVEVALLGVRDLKPVLWTFLDQTLRVVGRQFGIEQVQAAELEMRLVLDKAAGDIGFGLRLPMLAASLQLDEDTERYLAQRIQTDRAGNMAGDRHDLARLKAEHEQQQAAWRNRLEQAKAEWQAQLDQVQAEGRGRLEQAQAAHNRDLEAAQAIHRRELEAKQNEHAWQIEQAQSAHRRALDTAQADHSRVIERLNTEHETKLKSQRLAFYRQALGGNHHEIMVLQLIENPGDIGAVLSLIEAGTEKHYLRSREVLKDLLADNLASASDVDKLTQHTITELQAALSAAAPHSTTVIKEEVNERVRTERDKHTERVTRTIS